MGNQLEEIISKLPNNEARAKAIEMLQRKQNVPEDLVALAVKSFMEEAKTKHGPHRSTCYERAARIAHKGQLYRLAVQCYKESGHITIAGSIAEEEGLIEEAIEVYRDEDPYQAIELAKQIGDHKTVMELFEQTNQLTPAANYAKKRGLVMEWKRLTLKQIEESEKRGLFTSAAYLATTIEDYVRSKQLYRKGIEKAAAEGDFDHARRIAKEAGFKEDEETYTDLIKLLGICKRNF